MEEDQLKTTFLDLIKTFVSYQNGKNIRDKITNYLDFIDVENPKRDIFEAIKYFLEEGKDEIIKNELLGFKNTFLKIFVDLLKNDNYKSGYLKEYLTSSSVDKKIIKRMKISLILCRVDPYIPPFKLFFLILNNQKFEELKQFIKRFLSIPFENWEDFNNKIDTINEEEIDKLYFSNDELSKVKINELIANNDDFLNYFGQQSSQSLNIFNKNDNQENNIKKKKHKKNKRKSNEDEKIPNPEQTNKAIEEKEKESLNQQRRERIFELISSSITSIKLNAHEFEKININDFINNNNNIENISEDDLSIDDYKINNNKNLYLFSPISLIFNNNIKKEFEKNDFEIFNKDNNYIEIFGKYLEQIIEKLNNYINKGENMDYIIENGIKFGRYKKYYYLCCKFNEEFKKKYYNEQNVFECIKKNNDNMEEIKILNINKIKEGDNMGSMEKESKKKEEIEDKKDEETKEENNSETKEEKNSEKNEETDFSYSSNAKISKDNYRNIMSHNFENDVKDFFNKSKDCKSLQNLIFYFNLKMVAKSKKLKSVLITINNKPISNLYGFKEIDFCLKNKTSRIMKTDDILSNNLIYTFNNNKKKRYFQLNKTQSIDISLEQNSIIFGEIKNSFPYTITKGEQKFQIIELKEENKYENIIKGNDISFTYIDHLYILLKKAEIFFELFLEEKIINPSESFHIIYLYDESNFSEWISEKKEIEKQIEDFFNKTKVPKSFKNQKVIFQIAYFNKINYINHKNKEKDETIENLKKKGREDSETIENLKKKGIEDNETKKEETKKEEEKKEDAKKEESKEVEVVVKPQIAEKVGMNNLVNNSHLLSTEKTWEELGIEDNIKKGLIEMDFISPSKIQSTTFPLIMKEPRSNIVAQAKNGSGKTGAFGLGVISSIDEKVNSLQAVVFAHTRELVIQIKDVLSKMAKFTKIKVQSLLTGEDQPKEIGHIIVITPGHFENCFLKRDKDKLKNLKILVLDEADYMLTNDVTSKVCDRSFKLFQKEKMNVQILFFSATFDEKCFKFIKRFYTDAHIIELKKEELTLENVKQYYKDCKTEDDKVKFIEEYLKVSHGSSRVIIFANRRDYVVKLQQKLLEDGHKVYILMGGDMAHENRDETIAKFREGKIQILITTDLLSRGYDERLVRLVINFDLPVKKGPFGNEANYETYLHRIGRAGRFGTQGIGINLCCGKNDFEILKNIENYYKTKIEEMPDLNILIEDLKKFYEEKF